jgi:hypothetical protein
VKIRIQLPDHLVGYTQILKDKQQHYIDEILLWGMEIEMEIELYTIQHPPTPAWALRKRAVKEPTWLVFIVEPQHHLMFALKWGALQHKGKKKHETHIRD